MVGCFPDRGVGVRLTRPLREARAKQVAVDGFKAPAEQPFPTREDALADESLHGEHHGKQEGDPERAAENDLAVAFLGSFQKADADKAKGEEMEGDHAEGALIEHSPAFRSRYAEPADIDKRKTDDAADQGCRKQQPLQKGNLGPEVCPEHEQNADPYESGEIGEKRRFHNQLPCCCQFKVPWTSSLPTSVARMGISLMLSRGTSSGFSSRMTMSASLPGSSEPLLRSSQA